MIVAAKTNIVGTTAMTITKAIITKMIAKSTTKTIAINHLIMAKIVVRITKMIALSHLATKTMTNNTALFAR